jgi:hypothetical protein
MHMTGLEAFRAFVFIIAFALYAWATWRVWRSAEYRGQLPSMAWRTVMVALLLFGVLLACVFDTFPPFWIGVAQVLSSCVGFILLGLGIAYYYPTLRKTRDDT